MSQPLDREATLVLMQEYVQSESLRRHMLCVEAAMRAYARKWGEDETKYGIVGLLHDFDYERWPDPPNHPLKGADILRERGYPEEIIYAIKSHADYLPDCPRVSRLDKTLYACDELCGFLVACAAVRPEKLVGMEAKSVRKKLKQKSFAAAVNRDDIDRGAADLGVDLDEHIQFCIAALNEMPTASRQFGSISGQQTSALKNKRRPGTCSRTISRSLKKNVREHVPGRRLAAEAESLCPEMLPN